jgi:hypothetical protein
LKTMRLLFLLPLLIGAGCFGGAAAFPQAVKPAAVTTPAVPAKKVEAEKPAPALSVTAQIALTSMVVKIRANQEEIAALNKALADKAQLATTSPIAVRAMVDLSADDQQQTKDLQSAVKKIEAEIAADHPGFHFDENTGAIVKDAAAPAKK